MVSPFLRSRRGASKLGCLLSLVLFVGSLTYGVRIGRIYWRYYELTEDMKNTISHRAKAIHDLEAKLPTLCGGV